MGKRSDGGIYGPLLTYVYKKSDKALQVFKATTNYFLNNIPPDYIAYWDLCFTDGSTEPRDTTSDAIALCGMLEGIKYMDKDDPLRQIYVNATKHIMNALIDGYISASVPESNGLLLHQTTLSRRASVSMSTISGVTTPIWRLSTECSIPI